MMSGAFWFGFVVGFVTYRTLRHTTTAGLNDIAAVIGAIGGGAVLKLFPPDTVSFNDYAFGLALGFFLYLAISLIIAAAVSGVATKATKAAAAANELLGN
jgi:hypothetical protein